MNYKIINIFMKNRLFEKLYIFIGNIEEQKIFSLKKIFNKNSLSNTDIKDLQKNYSENSNYWIKIHKDNIPIILINDLILK